MDVFESLTGSGGSFNVKTVGMHTAGEPTRIVIQGFPPLAGHTLLEKRANAKTHHDDVRKRLMHEPRGHRDMYGAILVHETELVQSGTADIGVLFCHHEGFSTMCGHATLALGRFLIDTHDITVFPRRPFLPVDAHHGRTTLTLHAPCGPVHVSVPVLSPAGSDTSIMKSDPSRSVWFLSVPSFATATDLLLHIPDAYSWPELLASGSHCRVKLDIAFGGAFYAIVSVQALGFSGEEPLDIGLDSGKYSLRALDNATGRLKAYLTDTPKYEALLRHPTSPELEFLYGIIVVDPPRPPAAAYTSSNHSEYEFSSEVGVCFFADQQIDRSPCGSGVCARVALALAKGDRKLNFPWLYHSLVTKRKGEGAFIARAVEHVLLNHQGNVVGTEEGWDAWVIKVEGKAYYSDATTFVMEDGDRIGSEGFSL